MRLVGNIESEELARKFSRFLKKENIEATLDKEKDANGQLIFPIWIHNEDKILRAKKLFEEFKKKPQDSKYDVPTQPAQDFIRETPLPLKKKYFYFFTKGLIAICAFIYLLNLMQEILISKDKEKMVAVITPIQLALFYDVSPYVLELSKVLREYPLNAFEEPSKELAERIEDVQSMSQWKGGYVWLLDKLRSEKQEPVGPMFIKIGQGQIWRVFSPCLLHTTIIHLAFNMLWLWVLGRQIEERITVKKMLLLIIFAGIVSNTLQYLVSGPLFQGFSGIVVAMAGFIWARQKLAPWEGYTLNRSTFLFLAIFVFGMLGLQAILFFLQSFGYDFALNIANTAHITGGVTGYLFGKSSLFAMETK